MITQPFVMLIFWFWFLNHFWRENDVSTTCTPYVLGPPNPAKKLANWVELLGQLLSHIMFSKFSFEPPFLSFCKKRQWNNLEHMYIDIKNTWVRSFNYRIYANYTLYNVECNSGADIDIRAYPFVLNIYVLVPKFMK